LRKTISLKTEEKTQVPEEVENEDDNVEILLKPAPNVSMHYVFQGTHFWAKRYRRESTEGRITESIHLTYYSFRSDPLRQLVLEARRLYKAYHEAVVKRVAIYRLDQRGFWKNPKYTAKRSLDTLHLPGSLKKDISNDARDFFSPAGRQRYAQRSIPYRRGYCFFGRPGNGKSSICKVLASEFCEVIFILDLGSPHLDDDKFLQAMNSLPSRCVVLIEDIDAAFVKREDISVLSQPTEGTVGDQMATRKSGISFSSLLNALDGVDAVEGRLLCITTNHVERCDEALLRQGRIDQMFEIKNAAHDQAEEFFIRWFTPPNLIDAARVKEIRNQADIFAESIPEDQISMAALQGLLISCNDDPKRAVLKVKSWVEEELKRCQKNA
jgi:chaperone BCS1